VSDAQLMHVRSECVTHMYLTT